MRHQADPRGGLTSVLEVARVAGAGYQRAGCQGPDARDSFKPTANLAAAMPQFDLALELTDLAVE